MIRQFGQTDFFNRIGRQLLDSPTLRPIAGYRATGLQGELVEFESLPTGWGLATVLPTAAFNYGFNRWTQQIG
ncbi:hypothetical protein D3C84_1217610 [compost metagenome]